MEKIIGITLVISRYLLVLFFRHFFMNRLKMLNFFCCVSEKLTKELFERKKKLYTLEKCTKKCLKKNYCMTIGQSNVYYFFQY